MQGRKRIVRNVFRVDDPRVDDAFRRARQIQDQTILAGLAELQRSVQALASKVDGPAPKKKVAYEDRFWASYGKAQPSAYIITMMIYAGVEGASLHFWVGWLGNEYVQTAHIAAWAFLIASFWMAGPALKTLLLTCIGGAIIALGAAWLWSAF